ncbi:MFS transporter [Catenuloplanes japonicus]|uniref:MFS transporter n=1 Tax=Catenuloplanes japonicus TaxID=33876 RepID=UPI000527294C|nr:MFS transporter [Catenuloplanes japonicus]
MGRFVSAGGRATLGVLVGLQVLDSTDNVMLIIFAPEIRASLGLSEAAISLVGGLAGIMVAVGVLPLGLLGDRHRRTVIAGVCTLAWAVAAGLLGLVQTLWQIVTVRILAGIGKANEGPIQSAILIDAYPAEVRGRVLGLHRGGQPIGIITGPVLVAIFAALVPAGHEPWRWAFLFLSVPALILGIAALRLREPARGQATTPGPSPAAFPRLRQNRTFVLVTVALAAFGLCITSVPTSLALILEGRLGQGVTARGVIIAVCALGGLAGATLGGIYADRLFRRSPVASLYLAGAALGVLGLGFAAQAYAPDVRTYVLAGVLTQGLTLAGIVPLSLVIAAVTPPDLRATAFALVGLFLALVGGLGGSALLAGAVLLWGVQAAIAVVAPAASVLAALILVHATRHLPHDLVRADADDPALSGTARAG